MPPLTCDDLQWDEDREIGYLPIQEEETPYDEGYFKKYQGYARTELGKVLTRGRVHFVHRHWQGPGTDVGIGCGQFLYAMGPYWKGFDVNPQAIHLLKLAGQWVDPYGEPQEVLTCWDSLEHVEQPAVLLRQATKMVFVSLPLFRDREHVVTSKHFRPNEHRWYWTLKGFVLWAKDLGFSVVGQSIMEQALGREDIYTFALKRNP